MHTTERKGEIYLDLCVDVTILTHNVLSQVNVRAIIESMMDRLASYATRTGASISPDVNAFKLFNDCITNLIENRTNMSLTETLKLQTGYAAILIAVQVRLHGYNLVDLTL